MPLYYFQGDTAPHQTTGQRLRDVWFVVHPNTTTIGGQGVTLRKAESALGPILVDGAGMTLYLFAKDSAGHSVCYDGCATAWPPLLVSNLANVALDGIGGTVGTTLRDDGNNQVTYNGAPVYYCFRDKQPGDTTGQNVGKVWLVVPPMAAAAAAPAPVPASLPKTGARRA